MNASVNPLKFQTFMLNSLLNSDLPVLAQGEVSAGADPDPVLPLYVFVIF